MVYLLQLLTVVFGVIATLVPGYFAFYFWTDGAHRLSRVLSYMLAGEAVSMAVGVYFAYHSLIDTYNLLSPGETMILRWVIFTTGLFSTVHLLLHIIRTQRKVA